MHSNSKINNKIGDRGIAPTRDCAHERNLSLYGVLDQYAVFRLRGGCPRAKQYAVSPDSGFTYLGYLVARIPGPSWGMMGSDLAGHLAVVRVHVHVQSSLGFMDCCLVTSCVSCF